MLVLFFLFMSVVERLFDLEPWNSRQSLDAIVQNRTNIAQAVKEGLDPQAVQRIKAQAGTLPLGHNSVAYYNAKPQSNWVTIATKTCVPPGVSSYYFTPQGELFAEEHTYPWQRAWISKRGIVSRRKRQVREDVDRMRTYLDGTVNVSDGPLPPEPHLLVPSLDHARVVAYLKLGISKAYRTGRKFAVLPDYATRVRHAFEVPR